MPDVEFGWMSTPEALSFFSPDSAVLISDSTDVATEFAPDRFSFFFRLPAAYIPGLQRFAFEIKPKTNSLPPAACLGGLKGRQKGPGAARAASFWGPAPPIFFFTPRSFYFRLLQFPDSRRQTRQFLSFRRQASFLSDSLLYYSRGRPRVPHPAGQAAGEPKFTKQRLGPFWTPK